MLPIRKLLPLAGNEAYRHPVWQDDEQLLRDCTISRLRRGGPGGQNRNKVETAVRLEHRPSGETVEANEHRSQRENRHVALRRLRWRLALVVRTPPLDEPHWREVTKGTRILAKVDARTGPQLVAHVLNVLEATRHDARAAADLLGVSRTQLVRFLGQDRTVLTAVNAAREAAGRSPLRR